MSAVVIYMLLIAFLSFILRYYPRLRYKLPPGPIPIPLIGNLHNLGSHVSISLEKMSQKYGNILSFWVGTNLNIVVFSSALAREVLKENDKELSHRLRTSTVDTIYDNGTSVVWSNYGPYYTKLRKFVTHELLSQKKMDSLRGIKEEEMKIMIGSIIRDSENGKSVTLRKYVHVFLFNFLTSMILGERFVDQKGNVDKRGQELEALIKEESQLSFALFPAEMIWWLSWLVGIKRKQFLAHMARRDRFVESFLRDQNEALEKPQSLLTLGPAHQLDEKDVKAITWDLLNTGMDTSTSVVECAMAEVVRHPRVQAKAQGELDRVIGEGEVVSEGDVARLPYLRCVIKEALRMYPPSPLMIPHRAMSDVKIGGFDVPKGTTVLVDVRASNRDPEAWKEPSEFRPERFEEEEVDYRGSDFRLLPFGAGRRMCPAAVVSFNMVATIVGRLLHMFHWDTEGGAFPYHIDMTLSPGVTEYLKTPFKVVATKRLPSKIYEF